MVKKISQNFLIDKRIAQRELKYGQISSNDVVLEIGPGRGILTLELAKKAKKVIAIEIDLKLVNYLKSILPENVDIINDNALNVDLSALPQFNKVVSNIPYHISSPLTFKLLDFGFDLGIIIYQKEFAERMIAKPGSNTYSRLSVHIYYKSLCEILETIPKTSFFPQPKVDSAMVKIIPRIQPPFFVPNESFFLEFVRSLFNQRRKKIKNILPELAILPNINLSILGKRVGELSPEQIAELSNKLLEYKKK